MVAVFHILPLAPAGRALFTVSSRVWRFSSSFASSLRTRQEHVLRLHRAPEALLAHEMVAVFHILPLTPLPGPRARASQGSQPTLFTAPQGCDGSSAERNQNLGSGGEVPQAAHACPLLSDRSLEGCHQFRMAEASFRVLAGIPANPSLEKQLASADELILTVFQVFLR